MPSEPVVQSKIKRLMHFSYGSIKGFVFFAREVTSKYEPSDLSGGSLAWFP